MELNNKKMDYNPYDDDEFYQYGNVSSSSHHSSML